MANQHPPSPQAPWVDADGRPTPEFFRFIDDLSQASVAVTPSGSTVGASATTTVPLYASQFGMTLQAPGESFIPLPSQPWLLRASTKYLLCGTAGTIPSGGAASIYILDPVVGGIVKTINVGTWPTNEIRGIQVLGKYAYFVDRVAGKLYKVDLTLLTLVGTVTGFFVGAGAQGPFGVTTDMAALFVGESILGASQLRKIDPDKIPIDGSTAALSTVLWTGPNTLVLGGDDTHNLEWDGGASIWVTNLSSNNTIYRVNKDTMTLTQSYLTQSGGQWGARSNGERVFYSEISNDTISYRRIGATGIGGILATLPAGSGVADLQAVDDELWAAFSTTVNADTSKGAVAVYDALSGAQKRVMPNGAPPGKGHCPSLVPFGPDMWSSDAEGQFVRRWRRKPNFVAPLS